MSQNGLRLYLKEIGDYPLLTGEQELELAYIMRDENAAQEDRDAARETMINCNLRLVVKVAKDFKNEVLNLQDLISEGNLGLVTAVEKFNPDFGYRFSTCAVPWIKQAIMKALTDQSRTIRIPAHVYQLLRKYKKAVEEFVAAQKEYDDVIIANYLKVDVEKIEKLHTYETKMISIDTPLTSDTDSDTVEDLVSDPNAEEPMEYAERLDKAKAIQDAINTLPERTQNIIRMRYGLGRKGVDPQEFEKEHTLEEVGLYIGLTRERIRQIEKKALVDLKALLADKLM